MSIIDRLFALRASPPFDQLRASELVLIASAVRERRYTPGEMIAVAGRPLRHLYVKVDGSVRKVSGEELPQIFGAPSLLFGAAADEAICAGAEGATCLLISRAHFLTITSECPVLLMGLMRDTPLPAPAVTV